MLPINDQINYFEPYIIPDITILNNGEVIISAYYIKEIDENVNGKFYIDNTSYSYTYTDEICLLKLPSVNYLEDKPKDSYISDMINQMTNLILYGVSRYTFENTRYLLLELKDNIFNLEKNNTRIFSYSLSYINLKNDKLKSKFNIDMREVN
jgi:hypothetical protein